MDSIDRAAEWRRLKDTYRRKSDDELVILADEAYQLTELAQQALDAEIVSRRLDVKPRLAPPEPTIANEDDYADEAGDGVMEESEEEEDAHEFNPEDLELVPLRRVWSVDEACRTKRVLDDCCIPSYLGDENLESVKDYNGSFDGGVDLKVPLAFAQRAAAGLHDYPPESQEELAALEACDGTACAIRCPRCHSEEIVFEGRNGAKEGNAAFHAKFEWRCDSCGHVWEDEGIEQPVETI